VDDRRGRGRHHRRRRGRLRRPDRVRAHKAEYFSAAGEGALIFVAVVSIAVTAIDRLLHPQAIEDVGVGLAVSAGASLINSRSATHRGAPVAATARSCSVRISGVGRLEPFKVRCSPSDTFPV
jgi:hypothetical protein